MHPVITRTLLRRIEAFAARFADPLGAIALAVLLAWFAAQGF